MAGFIVEDGVVQERVVVVHLSWAGHRDEFVRPTFYDDFWLWLATLVIPDMAGWATDEDAEELLNERGM